MNEDYKTVFVVTAYIGDESGMEARLCGIFTDAQKAELRKREIEENAAYHKDQAGVLDFNNEKSTKKYFLYEAKHGDWVNIKDVKVWEEFIDMPLFNFEECRMINVR